MKIRRIFVFVTSNSLWQPVSVVPGTRLCRSDHWNGTPVCVPPKAFAFRLLAYMYTIPFVFLGIVTEIKAVYQIRMITYLRLAGPFVLLRKDWTEWFWQVEASIVVYVQVVTI